MTIDQLRYFVEVCRCNSITAASKTINISQPSLTHSIKNLERELGYGLFYRGHNKISLTPKGQLFLIEAEKIIIEFDNFYLRSLTISTNNKMLIKVGVPSILGAFLIQKIEPSFHTKFPDIKLRFYEVPTLTGMELIRNSELDIFIGIKENELSNECNSITLFETEFGLVVSKDNPLSKIDYISKEMLIKQPLVVIPKGSFHYKYITEIFPDVDLNIVYEASQILTIKYLVENNYAATIIYKEVFENEKNLRFSLLKNQSSIKIGAFWNKRTYVSSDMNEFLKFLKTLKRL